MLTGEKLNGRMKSLDPEFSRYKDAKITGKRLFTEVTFNPSVINLENQFTFLYQPSERICV